MDPSEPSEHAAPVPKSGTMGITKQTTPAAKARPSPASDLSVDDDERSLRPIGEGKSKGKGRSDKGGRQGGGQPKRPKGA